MEDNKKVVNKDELKPGQNEYLVLLEKIFMKDEDGKKLLEMWKRFILFSPSVPQRENYKSVEEYQAVRDHEVYINEGQKKFVRQIMKDIILYDEYRRNK